MRHPIRIVLVDDHELVLEGLRSLLEAEPDLEVVAATTAAETLIDQIGLLRPDVVVLDLEMGKVSGIDCLRQIREDFPDVRVLILTAFGDGASMRAALEAGADGYALKTEPPRQTVASIRQVARGKLIFPRAAQKWLMGHSPGTEPDTLTGREEEILALVAEGLTNAQVARRLRVSENTVKFHLRNVYPKLGIRNRTEAARHYLRQRQRS